jgi:hypothetical protein
MFTLNDAEPRGRRLSDAAAGSHDRLPRGISVVVIAALSLLSWVLVAALAASLWWMFTRA